MEGSSRVVSGGGPGQVHWAGGRRLPCVRVTAGDGVFRGEGGRSGVGRGTGQGRGVPQPPAPLYCHGHAPGRGPQVLAERCPVFQEGKPCGRARGGPEAELSAGSVGPPPPTWGRHMTEHARPAQTLWVAASPGPAEAGVDVSRRHTGTGVGPGDTDKHAVLFSVRTKLISLHVSLPRGHHSPHVLRPPICPALAHRPDTNSGGLTSQFRKSSCLNLPTPRSLESRLQGGRGSWPGSAGEWPQVALGAKGMSRM